MSKLSHTDESGQARMVNVGGKEATSRLAVAQVGVLLNDDAFAALKENRVAKGDVLSVARVAGILAAKKTAELIPLCHPLPLDQVELKFTLEADRRTVIITSTARCHARTGVEMEALTAASVAALTVYDMLKAIQKDIIITDLKLMQKKGGKSGEFNRSDS